MERRSQYFNGVLPRGSGGTLPLPGLKAETHQNIATATPNPHIHGQRGSALVRGGRDIAGRIHGADNVDSGGISVCLVRLNVIDFM